VQKACVRARASAAAGAGARHRRSEEALPQDRGKAASAARRGGGASSAQNRCAYHALIAPR
jgi:hypothetical protein